MKQWLVSCAVVCACADGGGHRSDATLGSAGVTLGGGESTPTTADEGATGARLDLGSQSDLPWDTGGECAAQTLAASVEFVPVDVLLMIDTSNSMAAAIDAVEQSINANLALILGASGLDYRVIVAGDYPPGDQLDICISMPLSGTDCAPPPPVPALTANYFHYDQATGSGAFLASILGWYAAPDPHALAPGGYSDWLRPEANKVILAMTDGSSASNAASDGDAFDSALLALPDALFGTPGDRNYLMHVITSMPVNNPSTAPWLPTDPIAGNGGSIQQVAILTGGWRFPLSQAADFAVVFQQIAQGVVETTPVACSFAIPDPPDGETIDPDTIEIDYLPGGVGPAETFHQVSGPAQCTPDAFYIDTDTVVLCPDACLLVQADMMAKLDVRYGCDVGFVG